MTPDLPHIFSPWPRDITRYLTLLTVISGAAPAQDMRISPSSRGVYIIRLMKIKLRSIQENCKLKQALVKDKKNGSPPSKASNSYKVFKTEC